MSEYTTIELRGDEYKLRYDLNAICALEDHFGVDFGDLAEVDLTAKSLRFLLRAGLQRFHKDLSEEDVGALADLDDIEGVGEKIRDAMAGEDQGNPLAPAPNLATGTGPRPNVPATASSD